MHMASSTLPASTTSRVKSIAGVESATPIWYLTGFIEIGSERNAAYVIGLPGDPTAGRPWRIAAGKALPDKGAVLIDRGIAARSGVGFGDTVKILGEEFAVAGFTEGTASATGGSVAFISKKDWGRLQAGDQTISFVLARVAEGESPDEVAARIGSQVDKVTAQTRQAFAAQERQVVSDMSTDIVAIMNLVGFTISSAVMALTVYTATLTRRTEYGVLKALGARNANLYGAVLAQASLSVILGFTLGFAFTLLLSVAVPRVGLSLVLELTLESLLKVGAVSLLIAAISAVLPIAQIAGLNPHRTWPGRALGLPARETLRRRKAASGDSPSARERSGVDSGRRADGQPRFQNRS
jgi:putative ABC transport system permease protein